MALQNRNKASAPGEFLGKQLDFYTITGDGTPALTDAYTLNRVIEIISLNGQPVIMGTPTATELKFAIEHTGAWLDNSGADALKAALDAGVSGTTFTVTRADRL